MTTSLTPSPEKSLPVPNTCVPQLRPEEHRADDDHDQHAAAPSRWPAGACVGRAPPASGPRGPSTPWRADRHGSTRSGASRALRVRGPSCQTSPTSPCAANTARRWSSQFCKMPTAAAWSIIDRCPLARTPASRSDRCAATVVSRSSASRTGIGAMRARQLVGQARSRPAAAEPDRSASVRGKPDHRLRPPRVRRPAPPAGARACPSPSGGPALPSPPAWPGSRPGR